MNLSHGIYAVVSFLSAISLIAQAEVKCKCKNVDAVGEGNSTCTVAESGGKCTIDFNQFAPSAISRASAALGRAGQGNRIEVRTLQVDRPEEAAQTLLRAGGDDKLLAHTAAAFMAIPATSQLQGRDQHPGVDADLAKLAEFADKNSRLFQEVFATDRITNQRSGNEVGVTYVVTSGCMELRLPRGLDLMLKIPRSPSALFPRCQIR
jgi:hypothetical protein